LPARARKDGKIPTYFRKKGRLFSEKEQKGKEGSTWLNSRGKEIGAIRPAPEKGRIASRRVKEEKKKKAEKGERKSLYHEREIR